MKIGLISDTHIPSMGQEPPPQVLIAFAGVDLILHAGDVYAPSCIEWLERLPICGDDEGAKAAATQLVDETGFDAVDAGALAAGRKFRTYRRSSRPWMHTMPS